ncbi:interleukin-13 receptor subunit alpha-1 [Rana temporaria]|uniref:interleukin-13 receptor subunit alpha-1 n=1 Tax=Rana temporaria TaxID=8407 RepID=UPI001AAD84AD|nr:interleukin-13 receptor subunit alpha-1 [Rana temporaria]
MGSDRCCTIILSLWMSIYFLPGSWAKKQDYLPPPTNLTFGMDGMFCLVLQWSPSENTANCSIKYSKIFSAKNVTPRARGSSTNLTAHVKKVDLNKEILFTVQAECDNTNIFSNNTTLPVQIATGKGNPNTSVRNFSCIWYYPEYVQCTWTPGIDVPSNVNYTLIYWTSVESSCRFNFSQPKQFHDLLPTGSSCSNYTYSNGIPTGCQFKFQKLITTFSKLVTAVSDWSKEVKPYLYYVGANDIAKLKPPVIRAHRTTNGNIHISWNDTEVYKDVLHEVLVQKSNSEIHETYKDIIGLSKEIPNAASDVTYTVKVRARLSRYSTESDGHFIWSDWSEVQTLQGVSNGRDISILLLLLIPAIIIVAAVILLIYMRRLKILIFPRVPDPGKVLSSDLQQWLKNGRTVYNEPRKEEICPISMLETPLTSPPVE